MQQKPYSMAAALADMSLPGLIFEKPAKQIFNDFVNYLENILIATRTCLADEM